MVDLLLEKFDNVQVDASARISPEDADYCDGEQLAYERAHKLYSGFRKSLAETIDFEKEEWAARTGNEVTDYRASRYCETNNDGGLDGYKRTSLSVQQNNPAVRFYERLGYTITDEKLDHAGHEDYIMVKELKQSE